MNRSQHIRTTILVLMLALVFPLYGQMSCNRNCPAPPNPCEVSPGKDSRTGLCIVEPANGRVCDFPGTAGPDDGRCFNSQCESDECEGLVQFELCEEPMAGGTWGACISNFCVSKASVDECVRIGIGRVNCCTQQGCIDGRDGRPSGCANPLHDVPCDPSNIQPPGLPGESGICDQGVCVPQGGACNGVTCTPSPSVCLRTEIDLSTCACVDWPTGNLCDGGFCSGGQCTFSCSSDPDCDPSLQCMEGFCVHHPVTSHCVHLPVPDGQNCLYGPFGVPGTCMAGECTDSEVKEAPPSDPGRFQVAFQSGGTSCCFDTPIEAAMAFPHSTTYVDPALCDSFIDNTGDGRLRLDFVGGGGTCCYDTVVDVLAAHPDREICDARPEP